MTLIRRPHAEIGSELLGQGLTHVAAAGQYLPDGVDKLLRSGLFVHVPGRPGFEHALGILEVGRGSSGGSGFNSMRRSSRLLPGVVMSRMTRAHVWRGT